MSMMNIKAMGKSYRTRSIDKVARRLFGLNSDVVLRQHEDGRIFGLIVKHDRTNPHILTVAAHFAQDKDNNVTITRREDDVAFH